VATTKAALHVIQTHPLLREKLWDNANQLYEGLQKAGYLLGAEVGPIIAAMIPTKEMALSMWQGLLEQGIYVNLMIPPATPNGESLLRCSVSAAHTPKQIESIIQGFTALYSSLENHPESLEPQTT
jgi:8-amino-7-oxononanoate synthase